MFFKTKTSFKRKPIAFYNTKINFHLQEFIIEVMNYLHLFGNYHRKTSEPISSELVVEI